MGNANSYHNPKLKDIILILMVNNICVGVIMIVTEALLCNKLLFLPKMPVSPRRSPKNIEIVVLKKPVWLIGFSLEIFTTKDQFHSK